MAATIIASLPRLMLEGFAWLSVVVDIGGLQGDTRSEQGASRTTAKLGLTPFPSPAYTPLHLARFGDDL